MGGRLYSQSLPAASENFVLELTYFEDLPLGGRWTTRRRTLTDADIVAFTGVSGDLNPLSSDAVYARSTRYGSTLAQGTLVASAAVGLAAMDCPVPASAGMVGMTWKFTAPVRPMDSIHGEWRLGRKRDIQDPRYGIAFWQVDVVNQDGVVVATGEVGRLVQRRREAGAGQPAAHVAAVTANPDFPAPAPDDLPSAARRRRRGGRGRRSGGAGNGGSGTDTNGSGGVEPAPSDSPPTRSFAPAPGASPPAPAPAPTPSAPAPRGLMGVFRRITRG